MRTKIVWCRVARAKERWVGCRKVGETKGSTKERCKVGSGRGRVKKARDGVGVWRTCLTGARYATMYTDVMIDDDHDRE